jgi:hypothetical protein
VALQVMKRWDVWGGFCMCAAAESMRCLYNRRPFAGERRVQPALRALAARAQCAARNLMLAWESASLHVHCCHHAQTRAAQYARCCHVSSFPST